MINWYVRRPGTPHDIGRLLNSEASFPPNGRVCVYIFTYWTSDHLTFVNSIPHRVPRLSFWFRVVWRSLQTSCILVRLQHWHVFLNTRVFKTLDSLLRFRTCHLAFLMYFLAFLRRHSHNVSSDSVIFAGIHVRFLYEWLRIIDRGYGVLIFSGFQRLYPEERYWSISWTKLPLNILEIVFPSDSRFAPDPAQYRYTAL